MVAENNVGDGEERNAKDDIADRPAVIEGAKDENELGDDVDDDADDGPEDVDHPETDGVGVGEAAKVAMPMKKLVPKLTRQESQRGTGPGWGGY